MTILQVLVNFLSEKKDTWTLVWGREDKAEFPAYAAPFVKLQGAQAIIVRTISFN